MKIGINGISYSKTERKYLVRTYKDSKTVYLGRFSSLEEAQAALRAHEEPEQTQDSNTPILNSIRAQFAPTKKSNKKKVSVAKSTPKPDVFVLNNKSHVTTKKPSKIKSSSKSAVGTPTGELTVKGIDEAALNKQLAQKTLDLILNYLVELADERQTTVFNVIVHEVARLVKK